MSGFGIFWVILFIVLPIVLGILFGVSCDDVDAGFGSLFCSAIISGLILMVSLASTYPDTESCFDGGYLIPNKQTYNLYVEQDGTVEIQQIFSVKNGKHDGRLHFFIKDDTGQRISYTCPNSVHIEEYDGEPMVEIAYSYYATGNMKRSSKAFWKDNDEHHTLSRGCPAVLTLYIPKGTKIKTALEQ